MGSLPFLVSCHKACCYCWYCMCCLVLWRNKRSLSLSLSLLGGRFLAAYRIDPKSSSIEATGLGISFFVKKRPPLIWKFQNFHIQKNSCGHWFTYSKVLRKSVKRKWPNRCVVYWYSSRKNVSVRPLSLGLLERSRLKFYRTTLFPFPSFFLLSSRWPDPSNFRGDKSENISQTHYNIGVKSIWLLADSKLARTRWPSRHCALC